MVTHTYNSGTLEAEAENHCKFEACLGYSSEFKASLDCTKSLI